VTPKFTVTPKDSVEHESKCKQTGICCHVPMTIDHQDIVIYGMHCKFLVKQEDGKRICSVYENRFEMMPTCHHANVAAEKGLLHVGCAYNKTGKGKVLLSKDKYTYYWPTILAFLRVNSVPTYINKEAFLEELRTREPQGDWYVVEKNNSYLFVDRNDPPKDVSWNTYPTTRED
jgi:hypothetical protein